MKIIRSTSKGPTEKLFHHLAQKEFSSEGEMKAYLNSIMGQSLDDLEVEKGKTPLDQAQFLIYDAWEEKSSKKRIALARKALKIFPDCADAYNLLADEAETAREALDLYSQGVEAGRRALGEEFFKENKGHFWGMHQTRPFMRALAGKAEESFEVGEPTRGFALYNEMLELNPGDNQGIRYFFLARLGERLDFEGMAALLKKYPDDCSAEWAYTQTLLTFQKEGESLAAKEKLHFALKHNPFVADYLLERESLPDEIPDSVEMGGESEAQVYAATFFPVWQKVDGSLLWLERQEKVNKQMNSGSLNRNDPCICGSGKKQKKCCGA